MINKPSLHELKDRIQQEITHFGGVLPERVAIAWDGYLAALLEWSLISPNEHQQASRMLPEISDNPVIAIFLGRSDPPKGEQQATLLDPPQTPPDRDLDGRS